MNIRESLATACRLLDSGPERRLEAEILLCHSLAISRSWLYANPEQQVESRHHDDFLLLVQRRGQGEPIAYLTGNREFWSLRLKVTPDVLIPRPETELLVETVLARIPSDVPWRIADLGTGSGAIALAIARERPGCEVWATDISPAALSIAQENIDALGLGHIHLLQGSWFSPLAGKFNCIVSNPPYVSCNDPHMKEGDIRFEPASALTSGADAMASIRHIAVESLPRLEDGGLLAFEHGYEQGAASRQLLLQLGYADVKTIRDLAGLERVTTGKKTWPA